MNAQTLYSKTKLYLSLDQTANWASSQSQFGVSRAARNDQKEVLEEIFNNLKEGHINMNMVIENFVRLAREMPVTLKPE
jgi:exo-beta-1,3-glucanase (GH17 family)